MKRALADLAERLKTSDLDSDLFAGVAVEAIAVAAGLKPAARFTASAIRARAVEELLVSAGMQVEEYVPEPQDWGYKYATLKEREAFTSHDVRVHFAAHRRALKRATDAQRARDDQELGRALGYPECCIAANALLGNLSMTDMVRVARSSPVRDWRLNIFLTEMDSGPGSRYYLISHFPCHLNCSASSGYAAEVHRTLRLYHPEFARRLEAYLSLPVLLRDERTPSANRRHGNFGCILYGVAIGDTVLYDRWRSLRVCDDMADARLDLADCLVRDEEGGIHLINTGTGETFDLLEADRWQLLTF
jgi:hypothetical protein